MFLGRKQELNRLNRLYQTKKFQLFILYGRRRVGKTALIREFCQDKPHIFFAAELGNDNANLKKFSAQVLAHYHESAYTDFSSWEKAVLFINERQGDAPLVLVLDEFPYLAESNRGILSGLQHLIDHELQSSRLFLILCGSYVSFMEEEVLGGKSPLFGRRTAQLQLKPFDYLDSAAFLPRFSPEEQCILYGVLGGIPQYLRGIDNQKNLESNLQDLFLTPMGFLYNEPLLLLREEIQQPGVYNAILAAIAGGASKANEIAGKTGEPVAKCLKYMQTLISLGIIKKETPWGEKESSRRTIYRLQDLLFRFWYRYIMGGSVLIESEAGHILWQKKIAPDISHYMGAVFEQICGEYLLRQNSLGSLPFLFTSLGRWWGANPRTKEQVEIDLVAADHNHYLVGECKWRHEKTGLKVLSALKEKALAAVGQGADCRYILFSQSGFTPELKAEADGDRLMLVDLGEIMKQV